MKQKMKQFAIFLLGFLVAIGADQWTKRLAETKLKGQEAYDVISNVFQLLYSENRGAAFGIMQEKQIVFFLITICVLAFIGYCFLRLPFNQHYMPLFICLILIASGAVGNMIDRVTQAYVIDFLYFKLIDFPIFNVADCYVTIGTGLLMVLLLFHYSEEDLEIFKLKQKEK